MADEIYGIAGVDQEKPKTKTKTKTKVDPNDSSTYVIGKTKVKGDKTGIVGTWDGNNFVDKNGNIVK